MSCLRCGANKGIKHCRLCLKCYDGYINSRLLSDLTANFSPVSEYNRVVFDLYVASLKEVVCLGRLIQVAERFKVYLEKHPLPELVEWLQIIGLSEQGVAAPSEKKTHLGAVRCCGFLVDRSAAYS